MKDVPDTVTDPNARDLYRSTNATRIAIKNVAERINELRGSPASKANSEAIANLTISYRHLEDASMRLGKVMQALDGGVSVYDKATVVDTPVGAAG